MNTTLYDKMNAAKNSIELSEIVENFLRSIGEYEQSRGETYEDTADRFRNTNRESEADLMDHASELWGTVDEKKSE